MVGVELGEEGTDREITNGLASRCRHYTTVISMRCAKVAISISAAPLFESNHFKFLAEQVP